MIALSIFVLACAVYFGSLFIAGAMRDVAMAIRSHN